MCIRDRIYIALILRDDAAIEVATKKLAGLQSNGRRACGKAKIELRRKALQPALLSLPSAVRARPASRRPRSLMVRICCL